MTELNRLLQRLIDADVEFVIYGMRDFAIEDPDGNRISLGEELAKK